MAVAAGSNWLSGKEVSNFEAIRTEARFVLEPSKIIELKMRAAKPLKANQRRISKIVSKRVFVVQVIEWSDQ